MFAATRIARVLPYAQWVGYAIQFSYFGYGLYTMYRHYVALAERDQRNGVDRNMDQYMALVVRPLRMRQDTNNEERNDNNNDEEAQTNRSSHSRTEEENRATCCDVDRPIPSTSSQAGTCNIVTVENINEVTEEENKENSTSSSNYNNHQHNARNSSSPIIIGDSYSSPEITIIHDSRFNGPDNQGDETLSITSTSLESTDSNHGIINDMYSECFVCARKLDDPTRPVATLPFCMHPFHKSCLDSVIKWHQRCPVCDFHIFTPI